jgi:hypothetical protein
MSTSDDAVVKSKHKKRNQNIMFNKIILARLGLNCNFQNYLGSGGEDTKRNLKHVTNRAANPAGDRPERVSSVTRITSTSRACAKAKTFLRSAHSCFAEAVSFQTPTTL